jgi:general stress protein YciG
MEIHYHKHHLVPTHAGGTDDPSNLVRVNVAMHAFLHKLRYKETGDKWDKIAYEGLEGLITCAEATAQARQEFRRQNPDHHSNAGRKGGKAPASQKTKEVAAETARLTGSKPWWNNGLNNKRSYTCPGEGYVPGKLPCDTRSRQEKVECPICQLLCVPQNLSRHILSKHS